MAPPSVPAIPERSEAFFLAPRVRLRWVRPGKDAHLNKMKSLLKKSPGLYSFVQKAYYGTRRVIETHILGTRLQEKLWGSRNQQSAEEYWKSVGHPHRQLLLEKISAYRPLSAILEIGCNSGPNLHLLADRFPEAKLYGVEINVCAVEEGKKRFAELGINNVVLSAHKADDLIDFQAESMDVVFSDAVLIYIGPDKINKVIREMLKIGRKAVILNEWHFENQRYFYYNGHWVYNFRLLLEKHLPPEKIAISKIPKNIWSGAGWEEYGAIIEIKLSDI